MAKATAAVSSLRKLQQSVRQGARGGELPVASRRIPESLRTAEATMMQFYQGEMETVERAKIALSADLSFENLDRLDDVVMDFAILCSMEKTSDHVDEFVQTNSRAVEHLDCYMPVEHLAVAAELQLAEIALVPVGHPSIPASLGQSLASTQIKCVAIIPAEGTNYGSMAARSRATAEHALRKLRVVIRGRTLAVNPGQLRFRVAGEFAFSNERRGWKRSPDAALDLHLNQETLEPAQAQPTFTMPEHPSTDIDKRADVALRWIERSLLADERVVSVLFLFFALEALLVDVSKGKKARSLAFRRAMLSYVTGDDFRHPDAIYFLYDEVRSSAVHGGIPTEISENELHFFSADVRTALNQYLRLAREQGLAKATQLRRFLDEHEDTARVTEWLIENSNSDWASHFANED